MPADVPTGTYEPRLMSNGGDDVLVRSNRFALGDPELDVVLDPGTTPPDGQHQPSG